MHRPLALANIIRRTILDLLNAAHCHRILESRSAAIPMDQKNKCVHERVYIDIHIHRQYHHYRNIHYCCITQTIFITTVIVSLHLTVLFPSLLPYVRQLLLIPSYR
jgi:hypothetical protein